MISLARPALVAARSIDITQTAADLAAFRRNDNIELDAVADARWIQPTALKVFKMRENVGRRVVGWLDETETCIVDALDVALHV
jgi:hypothetical protein